MNPRTQCYRCQGYGHLTSQIKTLLVELPIEDVEEEDDVEVVVHQQDNDSDASIEEYESMSALKL